ncbi:hypothetical protein MLD38_010159 [Melastoma candidum]|uniref:Uncharacterized protein n=1 Tax=Melastoma candidum TaxID=119954 RepID=A0ACB9QYY4_9MYRT|nr:hypothetical protein MLD38_010159 [Melastoma candidum]
MINPHMFMVGGTSFPSPSPIPNAPLPLSAADSGLTTAHNIIMAPPLPSSRKRPRDVCSPFSHHSPPVPFGCPSHRINLLSSPLFEQEAALLQMQQRELDSLISVHTQRLRVELEERARQQAKALAFAIRGAFATKLREKDEEIQRLAKLNWGLQERVRSLCAENQLLRGLAQSNEAAANSLRTDLERILLGTTGRVGDNIPAAAARGEEDAESCCGSNDEEEEVGGRGRRRCKACQVEWLEETSEGVVVMPCRHVFRECQRCKQGSSRQSCPVCGSQVAATLQVHLPN